MFLLKTISALALGLFLSFTAFTALEGTNTTQDVLGGGTGTIQQLSQWVSSLGTVKLSSTTANLRVPSLANCDTVDTNGNGVLTCGTDATGGGGGSSKWSDAGAGYVNPLNGEYASAPIFVGTSTSGTSTFPKLAVTNRFSFAGISGTTWASFCNAITGGAGLCDGVDANSGADKISTSTALADQQIVYATGVNTIGSEAAFTYDSGINQMNVVNLSASNLQTGTFCFPDCLNTWPSRLSTSTVVSAGNLAYWTSSKALSQVATGTLTETITGLALSAVRGLVGGASILSLDAGREISLTASTTNWNSFYNTPSTRITAGTGLSWATNTLNCLTASGSIFGCLSSANWTLFNNKVSSTSIDTSAELNALVTDNTGSAGGLVFATSPTLTTPVLGDASATSLTYVNATSSNNQVVQGDLHSGGFFKTLISGITDVQAYFSASTTGRAGVIMANNGFGVAPEYRFAIGDPRINTEYIAFGLTNSDATGGGFIAGLDKKDLAYTFSNTGRDLIVGAFGVGTEDLYLAAGGVTPIPDVKIEGSNGFMGLGIGIATTPTSRLQVNGDIAVASIIATGTASSSILRGAGLTDCDAGASQKVLWDVTTGKFSCGTDQTGGGGGGALQDWQKVNGALRPTTTIGIRVNASSTIGNGTGAGGLTIYGGATTTGSVRLGTLNGLLKGVSGLVAVATAGVDYVANVTGDWTGLFDGQEGAYYLARANHTGTQLASTISDFVANARTSISETITGLTYTSGTGVLSLDSGFTIPSTTRMTNLDTFYTTPSNRITAGNHIDWTANTLDVVTTGDWTGTIDGNNFAGGAIATGDLPYGSGAGTIAERAIGTVSQILAVVGGLPTWVSTTTIPLAGDVTGTLSVSVVGNDSHDHTSATLSAIDISADTNLAVTAPVSLTGDTVGITADAVGDTQLAFNTGQNLTTTSNVTFADATTTNIAFTGEIRPDGLTCANGQILKKTATNDWDCATDNSAGSPTWDTIGDAVANGAVAMAEFVQTLDWDTGAVSSIAGDYFTLTSQNDATTDVATQRLFVLDNKATSVNVMEVMQRITNSDAVAVVTGLLIDGVGAFTTAIDVSDADIVTALSAGLNDLVGTNWSIAGATGGLTLGTPLTAGNGGTGLISLGTGVATWFGTPSSANLLSAVTGDTGSGALVFGTSPTFTTNVTLGADTIADFTGLGLGLATNVLGLNATGATDEFCLTYEVTGPTTEWQTCGGGGALFTDAGNRTYLTSVTDDLVLGGIATATAPFWFDVSATTSYIGVGGSFDSAMQFGANNTAWAIGNDLSDGNAFKISSSTTLGTDDFLSIAKNGLVKIFKDLQLVGKLFDKDNSAGSLGENLISTETGTEWVNHRNYVEWFEDFVNESVAAGSASYNETFSGTAVGCTNTTINTANRPGMSRCTTGTTGSTGRTAIATGATSIALGQGTTTAETNIRTTTLSLAAERYQSMFGFFDTYTAANQVDGAYLLNDDGGVSTGSAASLNWQCVTSSNSVRTFTTSATAVTAGADTTFKVEVNPAGTSVKFYVNDVVICTHTANIPTGVARVLGSGFFVIKSIGTTARTFDLDYLFTKIKLTTAR